MVFLPVQRDGSLLIVNPVKHPPVFHVKVFLTPDDLSLHLELDHGDRLVNPQVHLHLRPADGVVLAFQRKTGTWVGLIHPDGERSQRQKVDAVPVLQNVQVAVPGADPDGIGNTAPLSRGRAHPEHVMVSPLDIQGMVVHQLVHDDMRSGPPVVDVPHDMEVIHHQPLDQGGNGRNKAFRPADPDDGHDDLVVVGFLVVDLRLLRDQLLNHIGKILRQSLAHLGACILAGSPLAHLDQTVQVDLVPVFHVVLVLLHDLHLLFGIINQRRQRPFFL